MQSNPTLLESGSECRRGGVGGGSRLGVFELTDSSRLVVWSVRGGGLERGRAANKNQHGLQSGGGSPGWNLSLEEGRNRDIPERAHAELLGVKRK